MAEHTIKLTAEELTLIKQKREEEKALLNSYEHYKSRKIEQEQKRIDINKQQAEDKKKV